MAKRAASPFNAQTRLAVVHGKEIFLRDAYTQELRDALSEAHGEVEVFRFDGDTVEAATVLDELRSYGLMQSYKLVVLDSAENFLAKNEGAARPIMERYVENPVDHATLLLRADTWRRSKLDKPIEAHGAIVACKDVTAAEALKWCANRSRSEYGVEIDRDAAALLIERLGTSLTRLDSELGKLAAMVEQGASIGAREVAEMVGLSREEQGWLIQEALLTGEPGHALQRLHELVEVSRTPGDVIMWSMIDLSRKLHHASKLLRQKAPEAAVAKELKLWGPARGPLLAAARRGEPHRFAQLLHDTIAADTQRKTGLRSEQRTLECMAVRIADSVGV